LNINNTAIIAKSLARELVDKGGEQGCEEDDVDQVEAALYAEVSPLHLPGLLVGLPDVLPDVVALAKPQLTMLIWLLIFSFWSPSSRMMLLLVFCVSLATRFIILSLFVWSSVSLFRSSIRYLFDILRLLIELQQL
jgi:hypothetical protein